MARIITKEIAEKLVKKLKAKKRGKAGAHIYYDVWDNEEIVVWFSLRHGSEKDKGHDHIPPQLGVNAHKTKCLAQCTYSRNDYLKEIRGEPESP